MKESLSHAIRIAGLLEIDIARISASGNEAQQGLAADCAEHRRQLANKLRHIQPIEAKKPTNKPKTSDTMNTYEKMEKWMRDEIRNRGYSDSMSPSSLSGRYAESRMRIEKAEAALKAATDATESCLNELETRFPIEEKQESRIRL